MLKLPILIFANCAQLNNRQEDEMFESNLSDALLDDGVVDLEKPPGEVVDGDRLLQGRPKKGVIVSDCVKKNNNSVILKKFTDWCQAALVPIEVIFFSHYSPVLYTQEQARVFNLNYKSFIPI